MDEINNLSYEQQPISPDLILDDVAIDYLKESAKWTKIISIIGFVLIGLLVIGGLFASSFMSSLPGEQFAYLPKGIGFFYGAMYIVIGVIYIFPTLYLFNYSKNLKSAIATNNSEELSKAFGNLKSLFKFIGIFALIMIGIYVLGFLFAFFLYLAMV